jgi:putative ABC transport system permease protein
MTRSQVRSMIRWEALLDAVLGVSFGWVAVRALSDGRAVAMTVPAGRLTAYLLVVAIAGVLAGLFPARRAAQLRVLDAIATG